MRLTINWPFFIIIIAGIGLMALPAYESGCAAPCKAQINTPTPFPTEIPIQLAVAMDDLPRGFRLTDENLWREVRLDSWPRNWLPEDGSYFTDLDLIAGNWVRTDIQRDAPILIWHLVSSEADLASVGSDLSLTLEVGEWAIPIRTSLIANSPDNLTLYDVVSVMVVINTGVPSPTTIQAVQDAVIIELNPESDTITLAVADQTAALTLIWSQDNRLPLIFVRQTPG